MHKHCQALLMVLSNRMRMEFEMHTTVGTRVVLFPLLAVLRLCHHSSDPERSQFWTLSKYLDRCLSNRNDKLGATVASCSGSQCRWKVMFVATKGCFVSGQIVRTLGLALTCIPYGLEGNLMQQSCLWFHHICFFWTYFEKFGIESIDVVDFAIVMR